MSVLVSGLDEAGRGPLAGPVVAAAVVLPPNHIIDGLDDSKALCGSKRERLYDTIYTRALSVGVAVLDADQIDQINILQASLEAMRQAFQQAQTKCDAVIKIALVDGNQRAHLGDHVDERTIVGGDALEPSIMAASIIAKVHRDRLMLAYAATYPGYGFEKHKGYGTKVHMEALRRLGPCAIHRQSFAPVKNYGSQTS